MPGEEDKRGPNYLSVLAKAALAGGLASSVSVLTLHPIDTLKTRVQSTAGATFGGMARSAPSIGLRGLYRGIIPAVGGARSTVAPIPAHDKEHLGLSTVELIPAHDKEHLGLSTVELISAHDKEHLGLSTVELISAHDKEHLCQELSTVVEHLFPGARRGCSPQSGPPSAAWQLRSLPSAELPRTDLRPRRSSLPQSIWVTSVISGAPEGR